jgi:hypothetical protein
MVKKADEFVGDFLFVVVVQGYVNKYAASVVGFSLIFLPIYRNTNGRASMDASEIAK